MRDSRKKGKEDWRRNRDGRENQTYIPKSTKELHAVNDPQRNK